MFCFLIVCLKQYKGISHRFNLTADEQLTSCLQLLLFYCSLGIIGLCCSCCLGVGKKFECLKAFEGLTGCGAGFLLFFKVYVVYVLLFMLLRVLGVGKRFECLKAFEGLTGVGAGPDWSFRDVWVGGIKVYVVYVVYVVHVV
jgi:hypothetical protein